MNHCTYCTPNPYGHGEAVRYFVNQVFNDNAILSAILFKDGMSVHCRPSPDDTKLAKDYSQFCKFNFCPMCGRKL